MYAIRSYYDPPSRSCPESSDLGAPSDLRGSCGCPWRLSCSWLTDELEMLVFLGRIGYELNSLEDRITSYNVCYTKLLRWLLALDSFSRLRRCWVVPGFDSNVLVCWCRDRAWLRRERFLPAICSCILCPPSVVCTWSRIGFRVITSYSIHYTKLYEESV